MPVPHQPRAQLGELVARVAPGEHVEHRLEHRPGSVGERGGAAHERLARSSTAQSSIAHHRDDLLGEHVQRVARARAAPRSRPSRIRSATTAVCTRSPRNFGKTTPRETAPTWWPARPTRCRPRRDARRRLDLDDEVDRAHVDAELEAAGRDDGRQPPGLELLLDQRALLLADASRGGPGRARPARRGWRRPGPSAGPGCAAQPPRLEPGRAARRRAAAALVPDLVEPRGQPLGQPPRVGEHDGRAVRLDQVDDALLDVRPDRRPGRRRRPPGPSSVAGRARRWRPRSAHRHDDLEVELPCRTAAARRSTGRPPPRNRGDLVDRADGRGQADALRRRSQQRVEPLEATARGARRAWCRRPRAPRRRSPSRRPRSASRACEVSSRNSDSGVVIRTSGGVRANARRSSAGVSPERTPDR